VFCPLVLNTAYLFALIYLIAVQILSITSIGDNPSRHSGRITWRPGKSVDISLRINLLAVYPQWIRHRRACVIGNLFFYTGSVKSEWDQGVSVTRLSLAKWQRMNLLMIHQLPNRHIILIGDEPLVTEVTWRIDVPDDIPKSFISKIGRIGLSMIVPGGVTMFLLPLRVIIQPPSASIWCCFRFFRQRKLQPDEIQYVQTIDAPDPLIEFMETFAIAVKSGYITNQEMGRFVLTVRTGVDSSIIDMMDHARSRAIDPVDIPVEHQGQTCCMCLCTMSQDDPDRYLITACKVGNHQGGHCFHYQCVKPWIQKQVSCPMCKSLAVLPLDDTVDII
jgi:hypothetical protein